MKSNNIPKTTDLRVIAGKYKGAKLASPHNVATHPMGAREKNALFNRLQPWIAGSSVLDAYAGSGALGIEALSRGAKSVVFVEKSPQIADTIRHNLATIGTESPIYVESITKFTENSDFWGYFDLIIADSPYDKFDPDEITQLAVLLANHGILALSMPAKLEIPNFPEYQLISTHDYAAARIVIFAKQLKNRDTHKNS